jgi:restriction system protein
MPIPDFQSLMRPLLEAHADGKEHINRDLVARLGDQFGLTDGERREMLPSGGARLFDNRIGWAKSHITQAGLLSAPRRAVSMITDRGREALRVHSERIDLRAFDGLLALVGFIKTNFTLEAIHLNGEAYNLGAEWIVSLMGTKQ